MFDGRQARRWGLAALATTVVLLGAGRAFGDGEVKAAREAAEGWLKLDEDGLGEQTWDEASELLRANITRKYWAEGVKKAREARGALLSREPVDSIYLPRHEYDAGVVDTVILTYRSTFEKRTPAREQVAVVRDKDGVWRVYLHLYLVLD